MSAKFNLKTKLLAAFLCLGIIPFAVMAIISLYDNEQQTYHTDVTFPA